MAESRPAQVVVLGGGFAGLYAVRALHQAPVQITIVDRRNHHLFQPLLYQVATAALNPSDIASPIRAVLSEQANVSVFLQEARGIDLAARKVQTSDGELGYDYLIVATGATHAYFGHDEWERHAPGLKTLEDALEIRRRLLYAFEAAEREPDEAQRRAWLTFVIVGGGPTGVELAGAFAEVAFRAMVRDFRHIDPSESRILLVEGQPRLLHVYPPKLSLDAARQLERRGVEVRTGAHVAEIDAEGVTIRRGDTEERISSRTVVWAAGVAASPLGRCLGAELDRAGRVKVSPRLTVPGHDEVFVVGDLASLSQDGRPVPGIAPAAIQMGRYAARAIEAAVRGQAVEPFRYRDKGSLATIGRAAAVADFGRFTLRGFSAWIAWLLVHIFFLIGFRNRVLVLIEWAWAYLTFQRGARLITGPLAARTHPARPSPRLPSPPRSSSADEHP